MHRHRLSVQIRIRLQNFFQEMARADHRIEHPIRMVMLIDLRFHASQEALHAGIVDTLVFRAVPLLLSQAFLAQLAGRSLHQMVWTDELRIMRRVYDPNRSAGLFLIFTDRIENGWCQLEIEIIDMNHVRLKVVQHFPDLFAASVE